MRVDLLFREISPSIVRNRLQKSLHLVCCEKFLFHIKGNSAHSTHFKRCWVYSTGFESNAQYNLNPFKCFHQLLTKNLLRRRKPTRSQWQLLCQMRFFFESCVLSLVDYNYNRVKGKNFRLLLDATTLKLLFCFSPSHFEAVVKIITKFVSSAHSFCAVQRI